VLILLYRESDVISGGCLLVSVRCVREKSASLRGPPHVSESVRLNSSFYRTGSEKRLCEPFASNVT